MQFFLDLMQVIQRHEEESLVYGMNKAVVNSGLADQICGMDEILLAIRKILKKNPQN